MHRRHPLNLGVLHKLHPRLNHRRPNPLLRLSLFLSLQISEKRHYRLRPNYRQRSLLLHRNLFLRLHPRLCPLRPLRLPQHLSLRNRRPRGLFHHVGRNLLPSALPVRCLLLRVHLRELLRFHHLLQLPFHHPQGKRHLKGVRASSSISTTPISMK